MDPVTVGAIVAVISGVINKVSRDRRSSRKLDQVVRSTTTNHGKLMGEHVEFLVEAMGRVENRQVVAESRLDDIAVRVDKLERPRRTKPLKAAPKAA